MTAAWPAVAEPTSAPAAPLGPAAARVVRRGHRRVEVGASRFPAAPVQALLEHRLRHGTVSLPELAVVLGIPLRTLHRILQAQVLGWMVADRCAIALGYHPCQLWPDWFPDQPTAHDELDGDVETAVKIAG